MDAEKQWTEKDFKFERKVGEGAFGAVYKARNVTSGEIVAVKKLKIQENDRKNFEGIVQEMRILCSIDHKNIVSYKGAFWDSDKRNIFIVMEFLGGGDLNDKIQKTKQARSSMPETKIWSYFIQLLKGLKVLHELKIIHRDIKAANCFLTEDLNTIKLGDMNVSKVTRNNFASTQVGTPLYLSPQIWLGKTYDYKTDIWSLGVLLYEMCTLSYPFMGLNMNQLKQAVTRGRFAPLPGYLNPDFTKLITMMLQMDPTRRPSVDELLNGPIISSKVNSCMDMTISDMKRMNLRLMDTIKIPQNIKNVNLPKKKTPAIVQRSNSAANVRPSSAQSSRNGNSGNDIAAKVAQPTPRLTTGNTSLTIEKSSASNLENQSSSRKLPPVPSQNNAKALPPLGQKKAAGPLVGRNPPAPVAPYRPMSRERERENSRDQFQRQNSKDKEILAQANLRPRPYNPGAERPKNNLDRYRAPSAGKGARGIGKPIWWGS